MEAANKVKTKVIRLTVILMILLLSQFAADSKVAWASSASLMPESTQSMNAVNAGDVDPEKKKEIMQKAAKVQIPFIANEGQIKNEQIKFYTSTFAGTVSITSSGELVYSFQQKQKDADKINNGRLNKLDRELLDQNRDLKNNTPVQAPYSIKENLIGANIISPQGTEQTETKVNYFYGSDKKEWKTNLDTFAVINMGEVYPKINLQVKASGDNIEKVFIVNPGGDVPNIKLNISGADSIDTDEHGKLLVTTKQGVVSFTTPIAYQIINGKTVKVDVCYNVYQDMYGFQVGTYDPKLPLIIDPLLASTFVGGNDDDAVMASTVDENGNVYLAGWSYSTDINNSLGRDAFVFKYDSDLRTLKAAAFLGGAGRDGAYDILLDESDNVYLVGSTDSSDFPVSDEAYDRTLNGYYDTFITKLDSNLNSLIASTYFGGSNNEYYYYNLCKDKLGNILIIGQTYSADFPITNDAFDQSLSGSSDIFISKFSPDLSNLLASTYVGGNSHESAGDIAVDNDGNIIIYGTTDSTNYPVTSSAYDNSLGGGEGDRDGIVSKFNPTLSALISSTYIGGSSPEKWAGIHGLALDNYGNVFVTFETWSLDYPTTTGCYNSQFSGGWSDIAVSKLNNNLSELLASTLIGGQGNEWPNTVVIDDSGRVYVAGGTYSFDFPVTNEAYDVSFNGNTLTTDALVASFDSNLANLLTSTFFGGSDDEWVNDLILLDSSILITGCTYSSDLPLFNAYDWQLDGSYDGFVAKFTRDESVNPLVGTAADKIATLDPAQRAEETTCGDPIDISSGAYVDEKTLLTVNGAQPISFDASYNSLILNEGTLGKGWGHNFETSLELLPNNAVAVHWNANRVNTYVYSDTNQYTSFDLATRFDSLEKNPDGSYSLTRRDHTVYVFNQAGQLTEQKNGHGQSLLLSYESGQLETITEPLSGHYLTVQYNVDGLIDKVSDNSLNRYVTFEYEYPSHNLKSITDAKGQKTTYTYNTAGQVLTVTDNEGITYVTNTYDSKGCVDTQDDARTDNQLMQISYDDTSEPGKIISTVQDRLGKTRVLTHNSSYQLLSVRDELGNTTSYDYDAAGNKKSITDAAGKTSNFSYDERGNLLTITDWLDRITSMTYYPNDNLESVTNTVYGSVYYYYNDNNNLTKMIDALDQETKYEYYDNGLLWKVFTPRLGKTEYTYLNGLVDTVTDAVGNQIHYSYDASGRVETVTDGAGKTTTMHYDDVDNLEYVLDPLDHKFSYTYNQEGKKLTVTDPKLNTTTYQYTGNGQLEKVIDVANNITTYQYDGEERLEKIIDARGNITTNIYDDKGRLQGVKDPWGNISSIDYDALDRLTGKTDALGNRILSITYDDINNTQTITDAIYRTTVQQYDNLNRLVSLTDPMGRVTEYQYDLLNRLKNTTDPLNGISSQEFDLDGNLEALIDPSRYQTGFDYYLNGQLWHKTTAAGSVEYLYNNRGLLEQGTNVRGQVTTYQYYDDGRPKSFTDPTGTVTYFYDANGNIEIVTDSTNTITKEYDNLNRLTSYTDSQGNTIGYHYDAVGNLDVLTYPDDKQVTYGYDEANRLETVTDWSNRITSYDYDANGRLKKTTRPDGTVLTNKYYTTGELESQEDVDANNNTISKYTFQYYDDGNIKTEQSTTPEQPFTMPETVMSYTYDNWLNTYNGQAVNYDADGNMTTGPLGGNLVNFNFDSRNRLTGVGNTSYTYDAENNRISVTEGVYQTQYVINPNAALSQVLIKTDAQGNQTFYVYGLGLIGQEQAGVYKSYHYDLRGSTVALTDQNGSVTDRFQYGPYGELVSRTGTTVTPFLYNGRDGVMTDSNGLYYMRARYYNPEIRRFVNQDVVLGSIDKGQGLNRHAYVNGNPISMVDPLGRFTVQVGLGGSIGCGIGIQGEVGINISSDGISFYASGGGLGTTPAIGVGPSLTWTNAEKYNDINGNSIVAGGGYGPVAGGTVIGSNYTGGNLQLLKYTDLNPIAPGVYTGVTHTVQTPAWNPLQTIRNIVETIKGLFSSPDLTETNNGRCK